MANFKAIVIEKSEAGQKVGLTDFDDDNLMAGDVTVAVEWSTLNYKDGLAITGKAPVVRRFPMIPGIDFAGTVETSAHPEWKAGDKVILNGWGCGETHLGGYGAKARVNGNWLVPLPGAMTAREAMAIGTAGYTAMLAVMALERHGLTPMSGPVAVTGAAGGVGSIAIAILSKRGFQVTASTGRAELTRYLEQLGATEIIDRRELSGPAKPLAKERWAAAIDAVGSTTLANLISMNSIRWRGGSLRPGRRHGFAQFGGALYPARRFAPRHRFRHAADGRPAAGVETTGERLRPWATCGHDGRGRAR